MRSRSFSWACLMLASVCLGACESAESIRTSVTQDDTGLLRSEELRVTCEHRIRVLVEFADEAGLPEVEQLYENARRAANRWLDQQAAQLELRRVLVASRASFEAEVEPAVDRFLEHQVAGAKSVSVTAVTGAIAAAIGELEDLLARRRQKIVDEEIRRLTEVIRGLMWRSFTEISQGG